MIYDSKHELQRTDKALSRNGRCSSKTKGLFPLRLKRHSDYGCMKIPNAGTRTTLQCITYVYTYLYRSYTDDAALGLLFDYHSK